MNKDLEMNWLTKGLVILVIIVHIMFFVLEAIFWMNPNVHNPLLDFLNNPVTLKYEVQAVVLKNLFVNQGFYNLFLVLAGIAGLNLISKQKYSSGYTLVLLLCFSALGAGIVLACSTKAYPLAFFQAVPAGIAVLRIYPLYKKILKSSDN
jgi:putative membrane protein